MSRLPGNLIVLLLVAVLGLVAACGSDDGEGDRTEGSGPGVETSAAPPADDSGAAGGGDGGASDRGDQAADRPQGGDRGAKADPTAARAEFRSRLTNACLQARGTGTVRRPRGTAGLPRYAREQVRAGQQTLQGLASIRPPREAAARFNALREAYGSLLTLYVEAIKADAAGDERALKRLSGVLRPAEASVRSLAREIGVPACAPR